MPFTLPPIYPITDKKLAGRTTHLAIIKELVRGGARLAQIRDKETPVRELLLDLRRCVEFCTERDVVLIVNDRCDLALASGAAGVHLGQDDLPPSAARAILGPDRIVGCSTHTIAQIHKSNRFPIDYVGFGPVFATSTKESEYAAKGLLGLERACVQASRPVVAIGGIGLRQVRDVLDAGARSVAVISALMCARDLARQMEAFLKQATAKASI